MFIFRVDTGTMFVLDVKLAADTVSQLKEAIAEQCHIAVDKQVLLVSGGEVLDSAAMVCSYSAGTDTNPIFLFSKVADEGRPLSPSSQFSSDSELTQSIERSLELPANYTTVCERARLAQQIHELGREICSDCDRLVHEQHLQQQGWAAAVAHFDDIANFFKDRCTAFGDDFRVHLGVRGDWLTALENSDIEVLSKVPILPPVMQNALSHSGLEATDTITDMTLLEWISAKDSQSSLHAVAEQCCFILEQLDEHLLENIMHDVDVTLDVAHNQNMKEIQGLSERLFGLEQLMIDTKRLLQEQMDLANSFAKNQTRASNIGDHSIWPDLCSMHRNQLIVMIENHTKLKDYRRRAFKAKNELSRNLNHRLKWVAYAQTEIQKVSQNIMIYQENLKRARKYFLIVKQIQSAPEMYCLAVAEVVRRRRFSSVYLQWATDLSRKLLANYNEEHERRREFKDRFGEHFVDSLFPGLDDEPSDFGTKVPSPFDLSLPELTTDDMETLKGVLPDLALDPSYSELSNIAQMFLDKSFSENRRDRFAEERQHEIVLGKIREDKELESETDTDEFEKISHASGERKRKNSKELSLSEVAQLRQQVLTAGMMASSLASSLRTELSEMRTRTDEDRGNILNLVKLIQSHITQLTEGYTNELTIMHKKLEDMQNNSERVQEEYDENLKKKETLTEELSEELELLRKNLKEVEKCRNDYEEEIKVQQKNCKELERMLEENTAKAFNTHNTVVSELEKQISKLEEQSLTNKNNWLTEKATIEMQWAKELDEAKSVMMEQQAVELDLRQEIQKLELVSSERQAELNVLREKLIQTELEWEKRLSSLEEENTNKMARLKADAESELHRTTERIMRDHKMELENLRSRYRLMSSMDKSPSDSSLEKIDRSTGDHLIEVGNHEAILAQVVANAEVAKERAVMQAVEEERQAARARMTAERQVWLDEAVARACAAKDKKIEMLLGRLRMLEVETGGRLFSEMTPIGEKDEGREEIEMSMTSSQMSVDSSMFSSVAIFSESSKDAATSPVSSRSKVHGTSRRSQLSTSTPSSSSSTLAKYDGRITVTSCATDDAVLVVWNTEHSNYMILQESSTLYFLHPDCLDVLGLRPASDGSPRRLYATAVVISKEYCHARKAENRYHVPCYTKFYRVVVKPLTRGDRRESSHLQALPPTDPPS